MAPLIPVEDLCKKCRELPWKTNRRYTRPPVYHPVDHHISLGDLRNSAKDGCRTCQIFWLYNLDQIKTKVDDGFELKFAWKKEFPLSRIKIAGFSQRFTCGERERMAEDISMERSQLTVDHSRRDFGDIQLSEGQVHVSMPRPEITTGETFTVNKEFMARIGVYFDAAIGEKISSIPYDNLECIIQGVVKPWVIDCVQSHDECRELQQLGFESCVPTRLIDVGTINEGTVKLVDTGELARPRYLILSYCWGTSNDKSKTTQANIEQRKALIRIATLPKTIRDAITVTRHMGVRYLWADAICIIQQDKENNDGFLDDWNTEAAKMASYYSNALCCISNLSATDSSEGFLRENQAGLRQGGQKRNGAEHFHHGGQDITIFLPRHMENWSTQWNDSPLMRRAWALQEWILSPRILHCTKAGMFMECGGGVCQSNDPFTKLAAAWPHTRELRNILGKSAGIDVSAQLNVSTKSAKIVKPEIGNLWMNLVTFYSTMNLTDPTDRLVAIDGIARLLCAKYNIGYFAGVLSSHIAQTLVWKRNEPREEGNSAVIFPSWSWASTKDVEFPNFGDCTSYVTCTNGRCFLLSDKVVNYADPSTRLFPLRGPILPFPVICNPVISSPGLRLRYVRPFVGRNSPLWGGRLITIYMDSMKECTKLGKLATDREKMKLLGQWRLLVCLRELTDLQSLLSNPHRLEQSYYGLILENLEDISANAYRRIGHFEIEVGRSEDLDLGLEAKMTNINLF